MLTHSLIRRICTATFFISLSGFAFAQSGAKPAPSFPQLQPAAGSGTRAPVTAGSATKQAGSATKQAGSATKQAGSATKNAGSGNKNAMLGMSGYCPVCIVEMRKWVKGSAAIEATYDGKVYRFPEEKQKQMFLANPAKYVPALGGDCIVCLAKMGKRVPGSVRHGSVYKGRVYLFPDEAQRAEFRANPEQYVNADVANGGQCAVCKVEMNQNMPGNPEVSAMHNGMRYFFPGDQQRQMFLANPAKYTSQP